MSALPLPRRAVSGGVGRQYARPASSTWSNILARQRQRHPLPTRAFTTRSPPPGPESPSMAHTVSRSTLPPATSTLSPALSHSHTPAPGSTGSTSNTFLMSASPVRNRRSAAEGYKPKMISTIGAKPACLVNASVTYVGDDQIYAFGGFDQYTDEGTLHMERRWAGSKAVVCAQAAIRC